jgi:predicted phosphatase
VRKQICAALSNLTWGQLKVAFLVIMLLGILLIFRQIVLETFRIQGITLSADTRAVKMELAAFSLSVLGQLVAVAAFAILVDTFGRLEVGVKL